MLLNAFAAAQLWPIASTITSVAHAGGIAAVILAHAVRFKLIKPARLIVVAALLAHAPLEMPDLNLKLMGSFSSHIYCNLNFF